MRPILVITIFNIKHIAYFDHVTGRAEPKLDCQITNKASGCLVIILAG
jgi:hypothetical protein